MKSNNRYLAKNSFSRLLTFSALYFAQGIPQGITFAAIPAWLAMNGKTPMEIASFAAIVTIPWSFKIVIAPLLDRYTLLSMGRKRPWVILGQLGLIVSFLSFMLVDDPLNNLQSLNIAGFFVSFFGAIQDVATDGMAVDVVPEEEQAKTNGFMMGSKTIGQGLTVVVGTALITSVGFSVAIACLSFATATIMIFPLLYTERQGEKMLPWTVGEVHEVSKNAQESNWVLIFKNTWQAIKLPSNLLMLIAIIIIGIMYGLIETALPIFTIQNLHWTNDYYSQIYSISTILAGFLGMVSCSFLIRKLGNKNGIIYCVVLISVLTLLLGIFEDLRQSSQILTGFVFLYFLFSTFSFIFILANCMKLCWKKVGATQFTLFMAINNSGFAIGSGLVGILKENMDWNLVFICIAAIPLCSIPFIKMLNFEKHSLKIKTFN